MPQIHINTGNTDVPDGWTPWNGGVCPVPLSTLVAWKCRSGYMIAKPKETTAGDLYWMHNSLHLSSLSEIIAYKVMSPQLELFEDDD